MEAMDKQIGKLIEYIQDDESLRNNTLILLCSDNGPEVGAGRSGELKGAKGQLYEGGIRSSLVVWGPSFMGEKAKGSRNTQSVFSAIDFAPSLLAFTNTESPENQLRDGENVLKTMLGESKASRQSPIFYSRPPDRKNANGFENLPDLAVREGDWKLLCDYNGGRPELYNVAQDQEETQNLAKEKSEIAQKLIEKVTAWYAAMPQL
jgi:arylsulfatase A-like enzyme